MKCNHCGAECSDNAKFCEQCGNSLVRICSKCGAEYSETAKFCEQCGAPTSVENDQPAVESQSDDDGWIDTGKKIVTTMGMGTANRKYKKGKGKAVPKKTIIALVIIFLIGAVGILSPYLLNKNSTDTTDDKTAAEEDVYISIINNYMKAKKDITFDAKDYDTLAASVLDYYHQYGDFDFYYAYADLDGNGTKELVIATKPDDQKDSQAASAYTLVDLYTSDDSKTPHKAIDNTTFGDRSTLRILADGTIIEEASSGADDTKINYYKISKDGYTLEKIDIGSKIADKQDFEWTKVK